MIVSHEAVKGTLFGRFLGCLIAGVGPKILELDLAKLEPKLILNGHEVDVRIAFERFAEVLRAEEGFEQVSENLSRPPEQTAQPSEGTRSQLESLVENARERLHTLEGEVERMSEEGGTDQDYLISQLRDEISYAIQETISNCVYENVGASPDQSDAEDSISSLHGVLDDLTEVLEQ